MNVIFIMLYAPIIKKAIRFSIKTHEVYQKQKRKGKDIPYITHPLIVGILLARAGADEEIVAAGILHDTIEDSAAFKKVTKEMLGERFGERVAETVNDVSELSNLKTWDERKREAIDHIKNSPRDSVLVKAADVLANSTELLNDYRHHGKKVFDRFAAPKDKIIWYYKEACLAILKRWPKIPFAVDLKTTLEELNKI
jgi:(p)ppGpp synthase/HD superfamily hydrolase